MDYFLLDMIRPLVRLPVSRAYTHHQQLDPEPNMVTNLGYHVSHEQTVIKASSVDQYPQSISLINTSIDT